MGLDDKTLGKNGQGNPIEICIRPRNEGLGYEGNAINGNIKFVKEETSTEDEIFTGSNNNNEPGAEAATTNQAQKQEQYCNHCVRTGHAQDKCWNLHHMDFMPGRSVLCNTYHQSSNYSRYSAYDSL